MSAEKLYDKVTPVAVITLSTPAPPLLYTMVFSYSSASYIFSRGNFFAVPSAVFVVAVVLLECLAIVEQYKIPARRSYIFPSSLRHSSF